MIRRLSTACAITNQHSTEDSSYLTTWIWYYGEGDTDKWHSYDAFDSQSKAALAMKMSSNTIELAYQLLGRSTLNFVGVNGRTFLIDFDRMVQQDLQAGTTFQVRRRPLFNANFDEDKQIKSFSDETSFFPSYWNSGLMSGFPGEDCELIDLPSSSNEYRVVYLSFIATMEHVTVSWIKAVQNPRLWMQYASKRESLREIDPGGAKEIYLFRSTSCSDAERICRYGFGYDVFDNCRQESFYFAKKAKDACHANSKTASSSCYMFCCRSITSSKSTGHEANTSLIRVKANDKHRMNFSASEDENVFPEFLIKYIM